MRREQRRHRVPQGPAQPIGSGYKMQVSARCQTGEPVAEVELLPIDPCFVLIS
jgi:hypothetical protein